MKVRNGFVSNSSSSSFLIPINALTEHQIGMIKNHIAVAENWSKYHIADKIYSVVGDDWNIDLRSNCLFGYTFMDNFNMRFFLEKVVLVEEKYIFWDKEHEDVDVERVNIEILQGDRKEKLDNLNR